MKPFYPHTAVLLLSVAMLLGYPASAFAQAAPDPSVESHPACLSGYPDGTYQGDRPVTRYEFAAGLNACMEQMLEPLQNADLATREDFEVLLQRQQELNDQLNDLSNEVGQPTPQLTDPTPTPEPAD